MDNKKPCRCAISSLGIMDTFSDVIEDVNRLDRLKSKQLSDPSPIPIVKSIKIQHEHDFQISQIGYLLSQLGDIDESCDVDTKDLYDALRGKVTTDLENMFYNTVSTSLSALRQKFRERMVECVYPREDG